MDLLGGSKPPAPQPVVPMPDPAAQEAAKRKAATIAQARSGRQSTILTEGAKNTGNQGTSETLG